jgi:hypothetical protein
MIYSLAELDNQICQLAILLLAANRCHSAPKCLETLMPFYVIVPSVASLISAEGNRYRCCYVIVIMLIRRVINCCTGICHR